ncbi:FHA domain-containing protein [Ramlibacter terrae]|uniref:FHA domain-containing protein n=1 Tax=Ramlibacter terrae TaxID=2732511 RepID=A0ABX6P3T2_9BURK|nr:FHA domain-containing protein [Ramlibacter terrae]
MALDLHIAGPGLDVSRRLRSGDPALVLGRDADCTVCLPDPERNVSRRHLSVWNEGDALHFHVLSAVNGVEVADAEVPPGARGVLAAGQPLVLSAFHRSRPPRRTPTRRSTPGRVRAASLGHEQRGDDRDHGRGQPRGRSVRRLGHVQRHLRARRRGRRVAGGGAGAGHRPAAFRRRPRHGPRPAGGPDAGRAGDHRPPHPHRAVGTLAVAAGRRRFAPDLRAEDRTMLEPRDANPLRMDMSMEARLQYLLGGRAAAAGFMSPDRAVADVVNELLAHQQAMADAVPHALQAVLGEFEPEALKARLLKGGPRLFEAARAWEAFVRDHAEQARDPGQTVQQWMDRHFAEAYVRGP